MQFLQMHYPLFYFIIIIIIIINIYIFKFHGEEIVPLINQIILKY